MADLPTNLKDDILDSSVNTRRKYRMIENGDGTYSFEDLTEYNQVGDEYGAGLINETNRQVNARVEKAVVVRDLETIGAITQPGFIPDALALKDVNDNLGGMYFYEDEDGNKYVVGADSVPKKLGKAETVIGSDTSLSAHTFDVKTLLPNDYDKLTSSNFYFTDLSLTRVKGYSGSNTSGNLSVSYDPLTGILTVNKVISYVVVNDESYEVVIGYTVKCIL